MKTLLLLWISFLFLSNSKVFAQCSLPKPENVLVTAWTSCDATLSWDPVPGTSYYLVRYKFRYTTDWITITDHLSNTSYTFSNLVPDSAYKFGVSAFCENGSNLEWKNAQKTTDRISLPDSFQVAGAGNIVSLSWAVHCPTEFFNVRYKENYALLWNVKNGITGNSYEIDSLNENTLYVFEVQGQTGPDTSKWSAPLTLTTDTIPDTIVTPVMAQPNFLIYLLDDGRYDSYQPNGGPAWFNSPSINRIANEGVNFVYAFPTTSQCAPSRVSIYSGLYSSHHGAVDNKTLHFNGIPLIQQILRDAGYYTGFVGKYGNYQGDPEGFDWWATSAGNVYIDPKYRINGRDTMITGHISDVYNDLAMTYLNSVPEGKKFCLMFFTRIPHSPTIPLEKDMVFYTDEIMPSPTNLKRYANNYPSYLYSCGHTWKKNAHKTDSVKLNDFRCLNGAEENVTSLMDWLTNKGILDSTFIVFSSDNGFLEGEHKLGEKQLAQEESIRVPMFIRYPAWFSPGQTSNAMATNLDIPVSILEAAGITDTVGMEGLSLRKLFNGEQTRQYFYYQFETDGLLPSLRAVRSAQYKYIKTNCDQLTEEFYDLTKDPKENTNEINNSVYVSQIDAYRLVMDSFKLLLNDLDKAPVSCYLSNILFPKEVDEELEELNLKNVDVYPSPASGYFTIQFNDEMREDIEVYVTNLLNERIYYKKLPNSNSFNILINGEGWPAGEYLVMVKKRDNYFSKKFTMQ